MTKRSLFSSFLRCVGKQAGFATKKDLRMSQAKIDELQAKIDETQANLAVYQQQMNDKVAVLQAAVDAQAPIDAAVQAAIDDISGTNEGLKALIAPTPLV